MAIAEVKGVAQLQHYEPEKYHPLFMERFYDELFLNQICNRDYEGEIKDTGAKVHIRQLPDVQIRPYKKGQILTHDVLEATDVEFSVNRALYWAFKLDTLTEMLTDMKGFSSTVTKNADKNLAVYIERELFNTVCTQAHETNSGEKAGAQSGVFNLGTDEAPVDVTKLNAPDIIAAAGTCLEEQEGGTQEDPFMIIPPAFGFRIQTSELKGANLTGDPETLLRKNVTMLGKIAGFTVYTSNLLSKTSGGAFRCIFGNKKAITYADQIVKSEVKPIENEFGWKFQALHTYDWKVMYPQFLGCIRAKFSAI